MPPYFFRASPAEAARIQEVAQKVLLEFMKLTSPEIG
jgi:hypothetical protein